MKSSAIGYNAPKCRPSREKNIKQPKYGYARARAELQQRGGGGGPGHTAPHSHHRSTNNSGYTKRMRFLSKSDKGWSWLSVQMRDVASEVKMGMARKGELPPELVQALWGRQGLSSCCKTQEAIVDHFDQKIEKKFKSKAAHKQKPKESIPEHEPLPEKSPRRKSSKSQQKMPETLMDVLLAKWVFFDHIHSDVHQVEKHVHAKYCEETFGHFLLPDGRQVHGSYSVPLSYLVQELRKLLSYLRSKIVHTHYKPLPVFSAPKQIVVPEFEPPAMKPLPQLYPIEGLLPIPTEESEGIGSDVPLPVFSPPVPKELPTLELPPPLRAPPLKLPPQPMFLEDENTIDKSLYKEEPLPVYYPPDKLSLPEWVEPRRLEYPAAPIPVKAPVLPMPVLESMPPFIPPIPDPRPCEKSYYAVEDDAKCFCEGRCMHNMGSYSRKGKPCQATPRALLPYPQPPYALPLVLKPEPPFVAPELEPLPEFHPPVLKEKPEFVPLSPLVLPKWRTPPAPDPIGYLAGQRPIFLIDASGTMAKGGMKMAHDILTAIFSPGGQVAIAATHFDIIMYSFDAWSYASMENYRLYKQSTRLTSPRFWSPHEAMIEKTPQSLEEGLQWALRWGAGGPTNLLKALDISFGRTFCDCIYLLTDGKPDKPVLVLQQIKRLLKQQGTVTPLFTIGLGTTKYGERFLHRISEATGGCLRHLDTNWTKKPPPVTGMELEDMLWAKSIIESEQRRNILLGRVENVHDLEKKVEARFEIERNKPRLEGFHRKQRQLEEDYANLIRSIEEENNKIMDEANRKYAEECRVIQERNNVILEAARQKWMEEVARVNLENKRAEEEVERWRLQVKHIDEENARLLEEAKQQFERDCKFTDEMNALKLKQAMEEYDTEVEKKKKTYEIRLQETERQQKELEETVATRNRINMENHQKMVAEITQTNKEAAEKAHADFNARVAYIEGENARIKRESEESFQAEYTRIQLENARKVAALNQKIQELRHKKETTLAAYKEEVATAMAEHDIQAKKFAKMNKENEELARKNWKQACEAVTAENMAMAKNAMEEYEKQSKLAHKENLRRAQQRMELTKKKIEAEAYNEELTKEKKIKWQEDCAKAEAEYEEEVGKAKAEHEKMCVEMEEKNAEALQAALLEHKAKVAAVESYNETIRPFVEASLLVKAEIARVERFIKYLGNACLDSGRPNKDTNSDLNALGKLEQGMETKLLVEALQEAYSSKREDDGQYISRPSFYSSRDFTGMIPIHPPRAAMHHCSDLDDHVKFKEMELERLRMELEEIKAEEEGSKDKDERPMFR